MFWRALEFAGPIATGRVTKMENPVKKEVAVAGPNFIGVGAARCGTTWLASSLRRCEGVWIPRRKELHYFSRSSRYPSPSYLEDPCFHRRMFGLGEGSSRFRRELVKAIGGDVLRRSWSQLRWDVRYFFGRNDAPSWYGSLFPQHRDITSGEITPAYGLLSDGDVAAISQRYPQLKVIYVIRNPVDRAWSTICYHQQRTGRPLTQQRQDKVIEYLTCSPIEQRSDYLSVVSRWRRLHGGDKFFLAYYDELIERPADLLRRLLEFLEIREVSVSPVAEVINASTTIPIPPAVAAVLAKRYLPSVEKLADVIGGPTTQWVEELKARVSS